MKRLAAAILLFSTTALTAQVVTPDPARKSILQNSRVTVLQLDVPPGASVVPHPPGRDVLTVIVGGGRAKSKIATGAVFFARSGSTDPTQNDGRTPLRTVTVEFAAPQGAVEPKHEAPTRYCNPGSRSACVEEKYLLCTAKICVEEVRMGAGAVTTRHSHDTDHMIIALSDYSLSDDIVGKGVVVHNVRSGEVSYIPAGITHTLTNKSGKEIHFVVVVFR